MTRAAHTVVDDDTARLYRVLWWGFVSLFPTIVLFVGMAAIADSASLAIIAAQGAVSLVVNAFALYALRQVLRDNVYSFPYGAGKLENFSAFLCGVLYLPSGAYAAFIAVERLIHPPDVAYGLSLLAVAASLSRGVALYWALRRIVRRSANPSPLLVSYDLDYRIAVLTDAGVLVSFAVGLALVSVALPGVGERIDPAVALVIALYMVWAGVGLVRRNFRALMDLPLSEAEQLKILRVLAHYHGDYEQVGAVCTRASGNRRYVEMELSFAGDVTVEHVQGLSARMEEELAAALPGLSFSIVARLDQAGPPGSARGGRPRAVPPGR